MEKDLYRGDIVKKTILFVDDEKQILSSLRRLFMRTEYETVFAMDGKEALEVMEEKEIDLIVTDIRMPIMDGYKLLRLTKEKHPKVIRMAFSGYTDKVKIFNALETGLVKIYIFKPWDNKELLNTIDGILDIKDKLTDRNIFDMFNNISSLPTIPSLYYEISNLIEKDADISEISKVIEKDQSISAKILHLANSSFYKNRVGSITEAVMYIGLENVKHVVMTNTVFEDEKISQVHKRKLWEHVSLTNKITKYIYEKIHQRKIPNIIATAGLMHDIGKTFLYKNFLKEYNEIMDRYKTEGGGILEKEREFIDFDHCVIGSFLLNWWEFPIGIIESALYHHDPMNPKIINTEIVALVHIADYYSNIILKKEKERLEIDAFDLIGTSKIQIDEWIEEMKRNS